ncbi:predicted protein [Postia placenta Mad-698-R]|uniref:C3H1-type domain-containing protein n=1 Tax=Postia placenta MAD-698-R-SB12 TaxID=670580 RepID=A0A1X6MJ50_9APHY|nr:hypothetical protein POSPLADRAFT_1050854 [Postia placenta MAD-698-R-SB12]EED83477.1 predicted protein [Postia placenta Mad-698-R]OSX56368.1 hypothetical protein POSPLADRAFT_1050854 [Postia placenta MAD-698-R-SB12]
MSSNGRTPRPCRLPAAAPPGSPSTSQNPRSSTPASPSRGGPANLSRGGLTSPFRGGPASPSRGGPASPSRGGPASPSRGGHVSGVPPRVCNTFWASGSCARAFECTFKHERKPATPAVEAPVSEEDEVDPDFFSMEGLAMNTGSVREERHSLTPSEAHNYIKSFLGDNHRFENASRVQGFVRILASVNDRNKSWAFLDMIVNGNAILRVGDILRFEPVSYMIGSGGNTLSFQKGYFPIFEYFASSLVLKTTLHKNINHLYTVLENNYDTVHAVIEQCVEGMIQAKSWQDPTPSLPSMLQNSLSGVVVFKTLTTVLHQFFNRFKDAIRAHPTIVTLINYLANWFDTWSADVSATPARFFDPIVSSPPNVRRLTLAQIKEDVDRLQHIVQRESDATERLRRPAAPVRMSAAQRREVLLAQLAQTYDPPGEQRHDGPRHDNDKLDISAIRIAPTNNELLCAVAPYLPVFLPDAPHHLTAGSMERHLDVQFRLLREDLIATMRSSIAAVHSDLAVMWQSRAALRQPTKLEELLTSKGGAYRTSGFDSVFFQLYTGVEFAPVRAERRDLTVGLMLDTPKHQAARDKDARKRYDYWEHSKRLQSGTLVALVVVSGTTLRIYLGVTSSFNKDIAESSRAGPDAIQIRVSFFDAEVEFMALRRERISVDALRFAFLVDNSVMFEAARPFLERLQSIEPTEIPFSRYIAHGGSLEGVELRPPRFATAPNFRYKLECLAKPGHAGRIQPLNLSTPGGVDAARRQLIASSILDPSQIDAVVNTLNREVSLIQGPPGTGKSFTAKEILRVLFASGIKPIDHLLTSILDAKITNKMVRLGSRSSDDRIAEFTLDKLEKIVGGSDMMNRPIKRQYAIMKKLEEDMMTVMASIQLPELGWDDVRKYLSIHHTDLAESFETPPFWIVELREKIAKEEEADGEWETAGKKKKSDKKLARTIYGYWRDGQDLQFISPPSQPPVKGNQKAQPRAALPLVDPTVLEFFSSLGFNSLPPVPTTSRSLKQLLDSDSVWSMSVGERRRLSEDLEQNIRRLAYMSNLQEYERLRTEYKEACREYNDARDEVSLDDDFSAKQTLSVVLPQNISPRVLMVEEAGQVLEAHVITSLVQSVNQLICIGDPQQLRPNLASFALSMDSERGNQLFKFDRSLMERLADNGLPMSQINVQRRMRPTISHFIRQILYPRLEDNDVVLSYPPVHGMQKDVYFYTHTNKENGSDDSVSKYNSFEVEMIRDLVLYFLKQGVYNGAGQLQKVRAALKDLKISVSLDERDQEQLVRQGIDEEPEFEEVFVTKHVRLGTVDIFQGQEAKIVIVSLVRNSGTFETNSASIGFLKSSNRVNVALSRAKHGLYILGNAANLRKNETWSTILNEMDAREQIGHGFPISCPRHPEQTQVITRPGEIPRLSPAGGCLLPCGYRLSCGHNLPDATKLAIELHAHVAILAHGDAGKTVVTASFLCIKSHCHADTSRTEFLGQSTEISSTLRTYSRNGMLPRSQFHSMQGAVQRRSDMLLQDLQVCMLRLPDGDRWTHVGNNANADRSPLQLLVQGGLPTAMRASQVPEALLRALCAVHGAVSVDMRPPFVSCCLRLDLCASTLRRAVYEHAPVWTSLSVGRKQDIVDFIMQRQLKEVDLESSDISERLIRLGCGHMFTVETLDGHCKMSEYYEVDDMGQFVATKAPPISYQTPPTCPTCRGPIDALRYGRVTKRATLDILEQNVASTMSRALEEVSPTIEELSSNLETMLAAAKQLNSDLETVSVPSATRSAEGRTIDPLSAKHFAVDALQTLHGLQKDEANAWQAIVKDLVTVYRKTVKVATTRGAHVKAYEAALATLYRLELDAIASDPGRDTDSPEPLAMTAVNAKIGQPPHKADTRFQIEAYTLSLEVRFMLAQVGASRLEGLPITSDNENVHKHRLLWSSFVEFILASCLADARKALSMAQRSSASRQAAKCALYVLRSDFEQFRVRIMEERADCLRRAIMKEGDRNMLAAKVKEKSTYMLNYISKAEEEYIRSRPSQSMADLREERRWFKEHCASKVHRWRRDCEELEKYMLRDTFYQPMSLQEKEDIVKAFGFSHRGHFYNCENGHTFVITEYRNWGLTIIYCTSVVAQRRPPDALSVAPRLAVEGMCYMDPTRERQSSNRFRADMARSPEYGPGREMLDR